MADTTYVDGVTLLTADTMNDLNRLHYTIFGDPATVKAAREALLIAQRGFLGGGIMANGTDATNDINVTAGVARDSTNAVNITWSALSGKQLDAAFAAGSNAGMRSAVGAISNATWHIYAIQKDSDGSGDILADTSATAPTMPSGYTFFRRIGSIIRSGATILAFTQDGDYFRLSVGVLDLNASNQGTNAISLTLTVPTGINVLAFFNANIVSTASGNYAIYFSDLDSTDAAASNTAAPLAQVSNTAANQFNSGSVQIRTNTSAQIRYRVNVADANTTFRAATLGWFDRRGRDA